MGRIDGIDVAKILRGIEQGRFAGLRVAAGEKTPFSELAGTFIIANGVADNQDLRLVSPHLRVTGAGSFNLARAQPRLHRAPEDRRSQRQHGARRDQSVATSRSPCASRGRGTSPTSAWPGQEQILEAMKQIGKNLKSTGGRGRDQGTARRRRRPAEGQAARPPREASQEAVTCSTFVGALVPSTPLRENFRRSPAFPLHEGAIGLISRVSVRPAAHPDPWGGGLSVYWLGRGPMAYTDSLFQLGMDLTRSSTAQKEDHGQSAHVAHDDRKDYFIERDGASLRRHPSHHRPVRRQAA